MSSVYLRVTNEWSKILDPQEEPYFFYNTSGATVRMHFSSLNVVPTTDDIKPFPLGGSISQICSPSGMYVFAKASVSDGNEVSLVADTSRITANETEGLLEQIEAIGTQLMKLSVRLYDEEVRSINRNEMQLWYIREYYMQNQEVHTAITSIYNEIINLMTQSLEMESYVYTHGKEFAALASKVDSIDVSLFDSSTLSSITTNISSLSASVGNIITMLNDLVPRVEEAWGDYDNMVTSLITPMNEDLTLLSQEFASLHNAIVVLGTKYSAEDIQAAFTLIQDSIDATMLPSVSAMKELMLRLVGAEGTIVDHTEALSTAVDYGDTLYVDACGAAEVFETYN